MNKIWVATLTFILSCPAILMGQPHCARELTKETHSWLQRLYLAAKERKP